MMKVHYFPVYVPWVPKPGLEKLGSRDYGNGKYDGKVFQIDDELPKYSALKRQQYKYQPYLTPCLSDAVVKAAMEKIHQLLVDEYPNYFEIDRNNFISHLTNNIFPISPCLNNLYMVIEEVIQEDVVIFSGEDKVVFAHVCFPSGWDPKDKIGKSFAEIHKPIPGIEQINKNAHKHVKLMVNTPVPLVRFIWGIRKGWGLNKDEKVEENSIFFMTERQCVIGLPEVNASIFTIRVRLEPLEDLLYDEKEKLLQVIERMSVDERKYKGINSEVKERLSV